MSYRSRQAFGSAHQCRYKIIRLVVLENARGKMPNDFQSHISNSFAMNFLSLILSMIVITALVAEIAAIALGIISPTQLLLVSFISGLLTLLSFKLSKVALARLNRLQNPQQKSTTANT